jgi:hypothetical protein
MNDWIKELPTYKPNGTQEDLQAHIEAVAVEGKRRWAEKRKEFEIAGYDVFYPTEQK